MQRSWLFSLFLVLASTVACRTAPPPPEHASAPVPVVTERLPEPVERALWKQAKQTFDHRCVVCHGCYDAPCQLVLSSFEGIARGATKQEVYDGSRLFAVDPTRLHIDAQDIAGWRKKAFYPVLPEGVNEEPRASLLLRMLELKRSQPLPIGGPLPEGFDLGIDRAQVCAKPEEFEDRSSTGSGRENARRSPRPTCHIRSATRGSLATKSCSSNLTIGSRACLRTSRPAR